MVGSSSHLEWVILSAVCRDGPWELTARSLRPSAYMLGQRQWSSSPALHTDVNILNAPIGDRYYRHYHQFVRTLVQTVCWCDDKSFAPVKARVVKGWLKMCRLSIYSAERADPAALSPPRVMLLHPGWKNSRDAKTNLTSSCTFINDALKVCVYIYMYIYYSKK